MEGQVRKWARADAMGSRVAAPGPERARAVKRAARRSSSKHAHVFFSCNFFHAQARGTPSTRAHAYVGLQMDCTGSITPPCVMLRRRPGAKGVCRDCPQRPSSLVSILLSPHMRHRLTIVEAAALPPLGHLPKISVGKASSRNPEIKFIIKMFFYRAGFSYRF